MKTFFDNKSPLDICRWIAFLEAMDIIVLQAKKNNLTDDEFTSIVNPRQISETYIEEIAHKKYHQNSDVIEYFETFQ